MKKDSFTKYLEEIKDHTILNIEEEVERAKDIFETKRAIDSLVVSLPHGRKTYLGLAERIRSGESKITYVMQKARGVTNKELKEEYFSFIDAIRKGDENCWDCFVNSEMKFFILDNAKEKAFERLNSYCRKVEENWEEINRRGRPSKISKRYRKISMKLLATAPKGALELEQRMHSMQRSLDLKVGDMAGHYLKWVVMVSRPYFKHGGHTPQDIISEGNIGLFRAIEHFDYRKGFRITTYARSWVLQEIQRSIADKGTTIRVDPRLHSMLPKLKKIIERHPVITPDNCDDYIDTIAYSTGLGESNVKNLIKAYRVLGTSSLNQRLHQTEYTDGIEAIDMLEDDSELPTEQLHSNEIRGIVSGALEKLENRRERYIITKRFGLDREPKMTLQELGDEYGISRERARQLEARGLKKLKGIIAKEFSGSGENPEEVKTLLNHP